MPKHKQSWPEIRALYETGNYSQANLAESSGYTERQIWNKATEEKWEKGKFREKFAEEATKKIIDLEVDKVGKIKKNIGGGFVNQSNAAASQIGRLATKAMNRELTFNECKQLKILSEILEIGKRNLWDIFSIVPDRDKSGNRDDFLRAMLKAHLDK